MDLGYQWQTAYMSPNEGGSGASAPLFADFCTLLLGWKCLGQIARHTKSPPRDHHRLSPTSIKAGQSPVASVPAFEPILERALASIHPSTLVPRRHLESELVCFQRHFIGGVNRDLEAITSGGGTRSINLAFESVITRARATNPSQKIKVLTGNPHLAVERAERRFQFDLVRLDVDGAIDVDKLKAHIGDPDVRCVYTQTLSFTDGITDPLQEILDVIESENRRRQADERITLINDRCCEPSLRMCS
jgi:glutamate/tyrosine decarboxylase-like PLP-dependent enzyme